LFFRTYTSTPRDKILQISKMKLVPQQNPKP